VDLYEDDGWRWLIKAIEYGLKQRGKTTPIPISSGARSETTSPLPSESAPEQETKAPPRQEEESQTLIGSGADLEWHLIKESLQKKKAQTPAPVIYAPPQEEKTAPRELIESFTDDLNGVPLEMIFVPGCSFKTDSPRGRYDYNKRPQRDERPQHDVTAPGFYIGKYQITQAQWKAVMGNNPSHFKGDPALPVENISWNDANLYCRELAKMTGKAYSLPSEAEWEYACRAGSTGDYADDLDATAWYSGNSGGKTHPVGQKQPNAFGLYDMHGNVWEWCGDVWHFSRRVVRGGSWYSSGDVYRSAVRDHEPPAARGNHIGFRVVVAARTV
jgi:formylglycine-generating enzyme required for sulfatase activity